MSRPLAKITRAALFALGLCAIPVGIFVHSTEVAAQPAGRPSIQALQRARGRVIALRAKIGRRLREIGEVRCSELRSRESCGQSPFGCTWNPRSERCHPSSVPENDFLAVPVLLTIQNQLFQLGQLIDQAVSSFPGPNYLLMVQQACIRSKSIESQARSGQSLAAQPVVGLVKPAEFTEIIGEMNAVQSDLSCP